MPLLSDWSKTESGHVTPWFILFLIFVIPFIFFPVVDIRGFPVAIPLLVSLVLYQYKIPDQYLYAGLVGSSIILLYTVSNVLRADAITTKDMFYWTLPLFYTIYILLTFTLFTDREDGPRTLHAVIRFFFYIQFIIVFIQITNPLDLLSYLEPYFQALSQNVGATARHGSVETLARRPGGTVGISTRLGFVAYALGRYLTTYSGRYRYVILSFFLAILASARMAVLTIVICEAILVGIPIMRSRAPEIHPKRIVLVSIPAFVTGLGLIAVHPFLNQFLYAAFSGDLVSTILSTHSFQHRAKSYGYLIANSENIIIGGLVVSEFQTFAYDSELVLRTLQFGLFGYFAFKLPLLVCWLRGVQLGDKRLRRLGATLFLVSLFSSLTTTTSSNMYFIFLFSVLIVASELNQEGFRS